LNAPARARQTTKEKSMFGNNAALEKEFFDLWQTRVFELTAMNYEKAKIAEAATNKTAETMMRKHNLSMPEMVKIIEKAFKNLG
jgi:hypothetical protein